MLLHRRNTGTEDKESIGQHAVTCAHLAALPECSALDPRDVRLYLVFQAPGDDLAAVVRIPLPFCAGSATAGGAALPELPFEPRTTGGGKHKDALVVGSYGKESVCCSAWKCTEARACQKGQL